MGDYRKGGRGMSELKKVKFLDYIELNPKVSIAKGEVCPFIEMANVDCNMRQPRSFESKPFTSGVKFQTYDTVIARIEPCLQNGKGFLFTKQGVGFGSTEYLVFRAKPSKTIPLFVYYFMRTHKIKTLMCNSMSGATGRQRVNNDVFLNLEVDIPSYDEQQRIATILSRYDSLIENYQKQIRLLEESAQRLYKEWFIDLRFPGHENTKIVDGVPEGWEKKKITELVNVQYGYAFDGKLFNSNSEGMPILRIRNIPDGITSDYTTEEASADYVVHNGDIVVGMDGIFHINTWSGGDAYLVQRACSFRPIEEVIKGFIFLAIKEPIKYFEQTLVGSTVAHLGKKHIDSIEILVPNRKELFKSLQDIFNQRQNMLYQIRHLTEARDRLLPKLMSGEIEV